MWVITNTDKNLGPCVVQFEQYISDAMVYLNDELKYEMLTEEEAQIEGRRLIRDIWRWTVMAKSREKINDDETKYIRKYRSANLENLHGYFCLLYATKHDLLPS